MKKQIQILIIIISLTFPFASNACSPLNVPTLISQSIVGSNLVLNWQGSTIYLCSDVIDVEIACNTAAYTGLAAYTYTSAAFLPTTVPYNYPVMSIPIGNLCPGTVYKFRARERNNAGVTTSAWSGNFTFTTPGVFVPPTLSINSSVSAICINGSSQLTANATGCGTGSKTYAWTPTTGLSCSTCSNPVASPTVTTLYNLTVTGVQTGCWTITGSTNITVNPCFLPIHLLNFKTECDDKNVNLHWETASEKKQ